MNLISITFLFASVFLAVANGLPAAQTDDLPDGAVVPLSSDADDDDDDELDNNDIDFEPAAPGARFRRVLCDLLSATTIFGGVNHSACALHCLLMVRGYTGGTCVDGVCICRTDVEQ